MSSYDAITGIACGFQQSSYGNSSDTYMGQ